MDSTAIQTITFTLRDLLWFSSLLVSLALAFGKLRQEIRHLDDTKAERKELDKLSQEIRLMIAEVRMDITRLGETVRYYRGSANEEKKISD